MGDRILKELPGWSLAWSDEFDGAVGSPVDPASWQPQVGGHGWGNQELQYYTASSDNAALDGAGNLAITVRRTDPKLRDRRFGWPHCGEIDVMENFGKDPTVIHGTVHGPGYAGAAGITAAYQADTSLADDFHVYAVHWEPGRIRWYLDDHLYSTVTPGDLQGRPWVFDHDFFLLLNVAVGGTFSITPDPSTAFPQAMVVDYIRIYTSAADGRS
jgi:hypothetical protein